MNTSEIKIVQTQAVYNRLLQRHQRLVEGIHHSAGAGAVCCVEI